MLTSGTEKAIPLVFLYSEPATQAYESREDYVDHIVAGQHEIHDLLRRNAYQAQRRQKLEYDRTLQALAYWVGEPV